MNIKPLSAENLEETIALAHAVFPSDAASDESPEKGFRESLWPNDEYWSAHGLASLQYWVLLDDTADTIIGVTGLYAFSDAPHEAWLAWFCIAPNARGKGLGRALLEWTMARAKEEGYTVFRLYTSTDPNEAAAQKLYDSVGLAVTEEQEYPDGEYTILYRTRILEK